MIIQVQTLACTFCIHVPYKLFSTLTDPLYYDLALNSVENSVEVLKSENINLRHQVERNTKVLEYILKFIPEQVPPTVQSGNYIVPAGGNNSNYTSSTPLQPSNYTSATTCTPIIPPSNSPPSNSTTLPSAQPTLLTPPCRA